MGDQLPPQNWDRPPTPGEIMLQVFSNGRFYVLMFLVCVLVCVTVLGALGKMDSTTITAILSALIGGAIGHVNGALQGSQETIRRFTNGPPIDPPKET